jgi:ABC-type Fe3+-hydroxamate transport system substrate-binding protein
MPSFTDQTGRSISLHTIPRRIISLVPSQTELLHYLGLKQEVVGITKFCIHPNEWFRNKTRVGGTKNINAVIVRQLQPDLIIANKEENVKEQIEALADEFPVWVSDVNNLNDALQMIEAIGTMVDKQQQAADLARNIQNEFDSLSRPIANTARAAYLIWREPFMSAGHDTFIHDMMMRCGFENVYSHKQRYPATTVDELKQLQPQVILLSSEPYPFQQKHIDELQPQLPGVQIMLVDGEMFSWYGSRLLKAAGYFTQLREVSRKGAK